jgi:hypothetical protein
MEFWRRLFYCIFSYINILERLISSSISDRRELNIFLFYSFSFTETSLISDN